MDILADLASSVHLHCLAFQFRQLEFNRTTGISRRYLKLQLKLIPYQIMHAGASPGPRGSLLIIRLDLEPIIIAFLIHFHVSDNCFDFLGETLFPFFVFWACVDCEKGDLVSGLFN